MKIKLMFVLSLLLIAISLSTTHIPEAQASETAKTPVSLAAIEVPKLLLLSQNNSADSLEASLPLDIIVQVNRFTYLQNLTASWDYSSIDSSKTGLQNLKGTVNLPEKYAFYKEGKEAPLTVEQEVWVYAEGMKESIIVDCFNGPIDSYASGGTPLVARETSIDVVEKQLLPFLTNIIAFKTERGSLLELNAQFDASLINTSESGMYSPFRYNLAPGIVVDSNSFAGSASWVAVVDANNVDLSAVQIDNTTEYGLYGTWLYTTDFPEIWVTRESPLDENTTPLWLKMELEASQDFKFQQITLDHTIIEAQIGKSSSGKSMYLYMTFSQPPEEGAYWFQIRYEGGESNFLHVVIDHKIMTATNPRVGDRIGDHDGNTIVGKGNDGPTNTDETSFNNPKQNEDTTETKDIEIKNDSPISSVSHSASSEGGIQQSGIEEVSTAVQVSTNNLEAQGVLAQDAFAQTIPSSIEEASSESTSNDSRILAPNSTPKSPRSSWSLLPAIITLSIIGALATACALLVYIKKRP